MIYELKNVSFSYDKKRNILEDINLKINKGDLITLLGKNGSGKTTLFSLMLGINKKYKGSIKLNEKEIKNIKERDIAKISGYVPQNHFPTFGFSVLEFVLTGLANKIKLFSSPTKKDINNAINLLKELNLNDLINRDYSELSGGEMQQILIARALISKPKLIIFDEPTSHLDYPNTIKILKMIKKLNKKKYTIIFSTHDPNQSLLLNSKTILLNQKGKIIVGDSDKIINEKNLKEIYGYKILIKYNEELKCKQCIYSIK